MVKFERVSTYGVENVYKDLVKCLNPAFTGNIASSIKTLFETPESASMFNLKGNTNYVFTADCCVPICTNVIQCNMGIIANGFGIPALLRLQDNTHSGELNFQVLLDFRKRPDQLITDFYKVKEICMVSGVSVILNDGEVILSGAGREELLKSFNVINSYCRSYELRTPTYVPIFKSERL